MNKKIIKDWTILIYANGNNELAGEMWRSKIDTEKVGSSDNVNIVMQIGKESMELVKVIRPQYFMMEDEESWTGVRRYYILNHRSILIKDLGKVNMADPHSLYDFISWGIENYPAKHCMVVLGGHGASFILAMPDFSQDKPYAMGTAEMCRVLNMILKDTGKKIDILVLDICYMNYAEIMYELGKDKNNTVGNVITYIANGPLTGLPYDKLINVIEKSNNIENIHFIIKSIIDNIDLNLVAIEINHRKLIKIKEASNELAYSYLTTIKNVSSASTIICPDDLNKQKNPYGLVYNLDEGFPWYKYSLKLQNELDKIVVYSSNNSSSKEKKIDIITNKLYNEDFITDYLLIYYKLSFANNNYWSYILSNNSIENTVNYNINMVLEPMILHPDGLLKLVRAINPFLNEDEIKNIFNDFLTYKNWDYDTILNKSVEQTKKLLKNCKNTVKLRIGSSI